MPWRSLNIHPFLTRKRLADIRLILGFDVDMTKSVAEVEDFLRAREEMLEKEKKQAQKKKPMR